MHKHRNNIKDCLSWPTFTPVMLLPFQNDLILCQLKLVSNTIRLIESTNSYLTTPIADFFATLIKPASVIIKILQIKVPT